MLTASSACRVLHPRSALSVAHRRLTAPKAAWGSGRTIAHPASQRSSAAGRARRTAAAAVAAAAAPAAMAGAGAAAMAGAGAGLSTFFSTAAWVQGCAASLVAYLAYWAVLAKLAPP